MNKTKVEAVAEHVEKILEILEVAKTGDTENTPTRYAKFLVEHIYARESHENTAFDNPNKSTSEVAQKDIPFNSLCAHHMLPFFGTAAVKYIPTGKIIGLSKLTRIVKAASKGLNTQEGIAAKISDSIKQATGTDSVHVSLTGRHMCMEMRGVHTHGIQTEVNLGIGKYATE